MEKELIIDNVECEMERELIYDDEKCKVYYDPEHKLIVWRPLAKMTTEEFKDSITAGMEKRQELFDKGIVVNWLNLVEEAKVSSIESIRWLNSTVNPQGVKLGTKKVAFTHPKDVFGYAGIVSYVKFSAPFVKQLKIKQFRTEGEAIDWLTSEY